MATTAKTFTFNVDGKEIKIRVSMSFDRPVCKWGAYRYRYNVYVSCNGLKLRTKYHDSVYAYRNGKKVANEQDLFDCLNALLNDACAAMDCRDFYEFKEHYGNTISEYRACLAICDKFTAMFDGDENKIFDILNIMNGIEV